MLPTFSLEDPGTDTIHVNLGGLSYIRAIMSSATQTETERAVLRANATFYRAFSEGDVEAMNALWSTRSSVACLHPGMPLLVGREAVLASWREILSGRPGIPISCQAPTTQVFGETAIVYCYEGPENEAAHLVATNVFVREDGAWRIVHHHAGPLSIPVAFRGTSQLMN